MSSEKQIFSLIDKELESRVVSSISHFLLTNFLDNYLWHWKTKSRQNRWLKLKQKVSFENISII